MVLPSAKLARPDRRGDRRGRRRARPGRRRRRAGAADPARELPAHPVHLGPDAGAAGDDRLDERSTSSSTTPLLNPLRAEVDLALSVITVDDCSDDMLAKGALEFSDDRQGGAGDRQPGQHGRADRRTDPAVGVTKEVGCSFRIRVTTRWPRSTPSSSTGEAVTALKLRRLTPLSGAAQTVQAGDRLDLIAHGLNGDATQFWHIGDANSALDGRTLVATPGGSLLVPKG